MEMTVKDVLIAARAKIARITHGLRRLAAQSSQPGTGGLIQPGDFRVLYPDGKRSRYMSYGDAKNKLRFYGGVIEWRGDEAIAAQGGE